MEKHDSYSMFIVTTSVSIDCVILMGFNKPAFGFNAPYILSYNSSLPIL